MNLRGELFCFSAVHAKRETDRIAFSKILDDAIVRFVNKHGYKPDGIQIRVEDCSEKRIAVISKRLPVTTVTRSLMRSHFILFPIVQYRTPRIVKERKPCLKSSRL